jgi:hypothetical protein
MQGHSEPDQTLKRPDDARALLAAFESAPEIRFELLFHASFVDKLLGVMRKAGAANQGFDRMQQTFGEAVQKVQAAIVQAAGRGFEHAGLYTERSPEAMRRLLELTHDLATIKQNSISD